jgi:hypothetical protein
MCCFCGGGEEYCWDSEGDNRDKVDRSCIYYNEKPTDCGLYDTVEFSAWDMCCGCQSYEKEYGRPDKEDITGLEYCENTNGDLTDASGDDCDWYVSKSSYCGAHDSADFLANGMCCACGGGRVSMGLEPTIKAPLIDQAYKPD